LRTGGSRPAWVEKSRRLALPEIIAILKRKLLGHWNYYGVIGNTDQTWRFAYWAKKMVYKWLNRRSQRKSFNVTTFVAAWERWQMPMPRVAEVPWPRTASQNQPDPVWKSLTTRNQR
jgi:RNA-directed DNA polymerase